MIVKKDSGFSLVEVIIAMTLLATIISGSFVAFAHFARSYHSTKNRNEALEIARKYSERIKSSAYISSPFLRNAQYTEDKYNIDITITEDLTTTGIKDARVKITWDEFGNNKELESNFTIILK